MAREHSTRWWAASAVFFAVAIAGGGARAAASTTSPPTAEGTTTTSSSPTAERTAADDAAATDRVSQSPKGDAPVPVRAHTWATTGNSHLASLVDDGDTGTEFVTQMLAWAPPSWAWLRADLGGNVPLARIEWTWSAASAADAFSVEVSAGNGRWVTVAEPGEAPVGQWTGITLERETRYVRFAWRNPDGDGQLGHLAEVRFLARPGFDPDGRGTPASPDRLSPTSGGDMGRPSAPSTKGNHWVVKGSSRSSNSPEQSSRLPLDGKVDTAWRTALAVPPRTGWTMYDLGSVVRVPAITWKFAEVGHADRFLVQVSENGRRWTTVSEQTNAPAPDTWVRLETDVQARFVRFWFANPNGDANLGWLSEVRFLHP